MITLYLICFIGGASSGYLLCYLNFKKLFTDLNYTEKYVVGRMLGRKNKEHLIRVKKKTPTK